MNLGLMPAAKARSKAEQSIMLLPAQLGASGDPNWVPSLQTARAGMQQWHATTRGGCMFPIVCALRTTCCPPSFLRFRSSLTCSSAGWSGGDGPSLLRPLGVFVFALHFIAWVRGCVFLRGWVLMSVHGWSFAEVALTLPLWPLPRGWVSAGHPATGIVQR